MSNYFDADQLTATTSTYKQCFHRTGWYFTVKFWIFEKRMFWCDECKNALPRKAAEEKGGV
jgi:hypothetical protein